MAEENGAINNDAGSSPVPAQAGDLVSTVEFQSPKPAAPNTDPEGAKKTEGAEKQPAGKEAESAKPDQKSAEPKEVKPDGEDDRFDKHPRFQELNRRVKESEERARKLEQTLNELNSRVTAPDRGPTELPFRDISKMKPEEILDWQSENPQEYYANILAQAKHELSQEFNRTFEQRRSEDAIVATYENFAKQNPDFDIMWDEGVLLEFMRNNPGHNAISAYHAITAESKAKDLDAKLQEAAKKAAKEAEEKFIKNQRAKRASDVLPQGPSAPGSVSLNDDALKDSKKFGGTTAVLAQRHAARRRAQAGV